MPRLLKRDSIRLLEASADALALANIGLAIPRQSGAFRAAAEIGLIGTSAELGMAACLVEAHGIQVLMRDPTTGQFKTGAQVLSEFKKLLNNKTLRSQFLYEGIPDPDSHTKALLDAVSKFNLLLGLRASGLHCGKGVRVDLAMSVADDVIRFLNLLAASHKMKPYLASLPSPSVQPQTKIALVEDLIQELKESSDKSTVPGLLASAFLVLPTVPDQEPDWLKPLERIQVAVNKRDVVFLTNVLTNAMPVTLVRQSTATGDSYLPVKFQPHNPDAVPVSFEYSKTSFTKMKEKWSAYVGLANGRLQDGHLDLPPIEFVLDLYVAGPQGSGLADADKLLPHTQTWPFIAASLEARGTAYPYWFLVRQTEDLNQLKAHLKAAKQFSRAGLAQRIGEAIEGIDCLIAKRDLPATSLLGKGSTEAAAVANEKYEKLVEVAAENRGKERDAGLQLERELNEYVSGSYSLGAVLIKLIQNQYGLNEIARLYWVGKLVEAMDSEHDTQALVQVLRTPELHSKFTVARKALRLIDFLDSGPSYG